MASGTQGLDAIAAQLRYAATTGAARLAEGVVKQARSDAEVGAALAGDGPGVRGLLARSGQAHTATDAHVDVGEVSQAMAHALAEGGAELAVGKRR